MGVIDGRRLARARRATVVAGRRACTSSARALTPSSASLSKDSRDTSASRNASAPSTVPPRQPVPEDMSRATRGVECVPATTSETTKSSTFPNRRAKLEHRHRAPRAIRRLLRRRASSDAFLARRHVADGVRLIVAISTRLFQQRRDLKRDRASRGRRFPRKRSGVKD